MQLLHLAADLGGGTSLVLALATLLATLLPLPLALVRCSTGLAPLLERLDLSVPETPLVVLGALPLLLVEGDAAPRERLGEGEAVLLLPGRPVLPPVGLDLGGELFRKPHQVVDVGLLEIPLLLEELLVDGLGGLAVAHRVAALGEGVEARAEIEGMHILAVQVLVDVEEVGVERLLEGLDADPHPLVTPPELFQRERAAEAGDEEGMGLAVTVGPVLDDERIHQAVLGDVLRQLGDLGVLDADVEAVGDDDRVEGDLLVFDDVLGAHGSPCLVRCFRIVLSNARQGESSSQKKRVSVLVSSP